MKFRLYWFAIFIWPAKVGFADPHNVYLSWNALSSPAVEGFNVYFGTSSGQYANKISVGNQTSATISNLNAGFTYYFAATSIGTNGVESGYSSELKFIVPGLLALSHSPSPGNPALIQFPVEPGHWYEVQATTNLVNWSTIGQTGVAVANAWQQFTDTNATSFASRYYRLVLH